MVLGRWALVEGSGSWVMKPWGLGLWPSPVLSLSWLTWDKQFHPNTLFCHWVFALLQTQKQGSWLNMDHTTETISQIKLFLLRFSQHFLRATKQNLTNTDAQKRFRTYKTINCSCGNLWKPCHKTFNETGDNDVFAIILHSPSKPSLLK